MRSVGALAAICMLSSSGWAEESVLMRLERASSADRNALLADGVPLVTEMQDAFLALGDEQRIRAAAARRGLDSAVLDRHSGASRYAVLNTAAARVGSRASDCGEVLWRGEGWAVLKAASFDPMACMSEGGRFLRVLSPRILRPSEPPPPEYRELQEGSEGSLDPDPLVMEMVSELTDDVAYGHWQSVVGAATTRYSTSQGCQDAADLVHSFFDGLGLDPEFQHHTSGHAPNVIGKLPGVIDPDQVVIALAHLDDVPSSGPAPGADDNASGSAMVMSLAEAMSCYEFAHTVKFLSVTGEEFGLYGSDHYAEQAAAAGENILAALNADMIGWEGNGTPEIENLDLNYNDASQWLGLLFAEAASAYDTGCVVDAFECGTLTASDHAPFWEQGFAAIAGITDNGGYCGHTGFNPSYHSAQDTIANCGPEAPRFMASATRAYLATAAHLAEPVAAKVAAPTGLLAEPDGDNRIALSWSSAAPAGSYEIYRAPGGCTDPGPEVLLDTVSGDVYLDSTASGGMNYAYRLREREAEGHCVSSPSQCVEATTTGPCTEPPLFAGLQGISSAGSSACAVMLDWQTGSSYCGGTLTYNVYRSTTPDLVPDPGNRIARGISVTSFTDSDQLVFPSTYYYVVRAEDSDHGLEDENIVELSAAPNGPGGGTPVQYASQDTPIGIPDDQPTGIISTLAVVDDAPIADIDVNVEITHSFIGDLRVRLSSPIGTEVTLHDRSGSSANDIVTSYDSLTQPDGPGTMADFDGENPAGSWTLLVSDHAGSDVGNLGSWSLAITPLVSCETVAGSHLFSDDFEDGDTGRWSVAVP